MRSQQWGYHRDGVAETDSQGADPQGGVSRLEGHLLITIEWSLLDDITGLLGATQAARMSVFRSSSGKIRSWYIDP